jgi:predicted transcriptional regulator of viral defense system
MKLIKAITLSLGEIEYPVITSYQLGILVFKIYKERKFRGEEIASLQKSSADSVVYHRVLRELIEEGILNRYQGFPAKSVFSVLGRKNDLIEDIVCTVDPFAYVSHLSAMEYHGLTNRSPSKLVISSPPPGKWRSFALQRMEKDLKENLEEYKRNGLPVLNRTKITRVGKKEIHRFSSVHVGMFRAVRDRTMRVSTVGRTFLEMLKNPELCGGINHVLEVYEEHAGRHLKVIVDEVDHHGGSIDKVRAGYILDERLGLTDERINMWLENVQRGGSRKLDASSEYEPVWSEKWCLSLNVIGKVRSYS